MRVTLDTNVWSYIAVRSEIAGLERLEDARQLKIVIPPSTLLEAVRTPNPVVRDKIIGAITNRGGTRVHLRSEARLEADELVGEIERLHPIWRRRLRDLASLWQLDEYWTRRVYRDARDNPDSLANIERSLEVDEYLERLQRETRGRVRESDFNISKGEPWVLLDQDLADENRLGWDGGRVMAWRVQNASLWWTQLTVIPKRGIYSDTTFFDWVNPRIDTRAIARDREAWNRLWYHEVDQAAMPRNWIREVVPFAQLAWKVGSGNPRDAQHAAYLFDTDLFITADKRYAMTLELVRRWTKTPFADVARIDVPTLGSGSILEQIEGVLVL